MTDRKDRRAELEASLRRVADYEAKGLMRHDEAAAQRQALERQLLDAVLPDAPAPRPPARARLGALAAMGVVVAVVCAWLLWGDAGLQPRTVQMLRYAARHDDGQPAPAPAPAASGGGISASAAPGPGMAALPPGAWVSGRVEVVRGLSGRVSPDDAVFITMRHPGDTGMPLAALRKRADDLPVAFVLGPQEALGDASRVTGSNAPLVIEARISRSGRGLADCCSDLTLYPQNLINVRVQPGTDWTKNAAVVAEKEHVERELGDNGRVLIRPSGTEPLVRVMVEAKSSELAETMAKRIAARFEV